MKIQDVSKTTQVSSNEWGTCTVCGNLLPDGEISNRINHYLSHGYKLLHVGTEGGGGIPGEERNYATVAVLGVVP
ncbi:hypothetical protein AGMMS49543_23830 [Betaproteobacteria bacterium]|nr:hypothetical protein AGMMS49543_23830 [Betaproteobacteria bacterium]GHU19502.1 hypothetical protein AGMMS50243_11660 [Betaproteobacteria bacterium]